MSLYWYLQYFAALGPFVSIRLWILFFLKKSINFSIKNQPKSNKKTIQNRVDFLIEFWTDIFGFGLRLGSFLALILTLKQQKNGGAAKGGRDLWQRRRAKSALEYPRILKTAAQGSPGTEKYHPMVPLRAQKPSTWI